MNNAWTRLMVLVMVLCRDRVWMLRCVVGMRMVRVLC